MNKIIWFISLNAFYALLLILGGMLSGATGAHPLYLVLLFALCTSPILQMGSLNDRYCLLGIFSLVYFQFYGVLDTVTLLSGPSDVKVSQNPITQSEFIILAGCGAVQFFYRIACRFASTRAHAQAMDWSKRSLLWVGLFLFLVCTAINCLNRVVLFVTTDNETTHRVMASLSSTALVVLMLAAMLQPLGILILAYLQNIYKRRYLTVLLFSAIVIQAVYGFIVDIKGEVLLGGVLALLTQFLVTGRIPKAWLAGIVAFIIVVFPVLQATRVVRAEEGTTSHFTVAKNIGAVLQRAIAQRKDVNSGDARAERFYERLSLKGSVDLIVAKTGTSVPFQHGYTLTPLWSTFIPKIIWPGKPDVQTGQLMNREFQVSIVEDTYISPSHLGELYWNYGLPGVLVGMGLIGLLLGYIGARFDLSVTTTLTRLLVLAVTIRLLILGAEGAIAPIYVTWLRSMAAIGLLHLVLARLPGRLWTRSDVAPAIPDLDAEAPSASPYPNVMR